MHDDFLHKHIIACRRSWSAQEKLLERKFSSFGEAKAQKTSDLVFRGSQQGGKAYLYGIRSFTFWQDEKKPGQARSNYPVI